ncbi:MAG: CPBP family intramembrane metalloprotease [Methanobacterium sp.]|nr:CPBP family intramembrane metalloprotease [Methanobacterium sp.]
MKTYWKMFIILLLACLFGFVTILPYSITLQGGLPQNLPIPLYLLLTIQAIENMILFAVAIFLGLKLADKVGLKLPVLQGWLEGREVKGYLKSILGLAVGLGLLAGILIIGLDYIFSLAGLTLIIASASQAYPPAWQGLLASFYGGINEEVLLRLFLMSLLVWIFYKIKKTADGKPTNTSVWFAIFLAAIIFGLGHLPALTLTITLTPVIIIRVILLNSIGGIIFGWLYWKKGLESAMISHFSADIVLHVILPIIIMGLVF